MKSIRLSVFLTTALILTGYGCVREGNHRLAMDIYKANLESPIGERWTPNFGQSVKVDIRTI